MPGRADRRPTGRGLAVLLAFCLALLAALSAAAQPAPTQSAATQSESAQDAAARWAAYATDVQDRVGDPDISTEALEVIRDELVRQRSEMLAAEQAAQPTVNELNERLKAIGSPPAEGTEEAPEVASLRKDLKRQVADALAPVQTAQEAQRRADTQIAAIDRVVRARFQAELLSRGAVPVAPSTWLGAIDELHDQFVGYRTALTEELKEADNRDRTLQRLPVTLLLILAGLAVAVIARRWVTEWLEKRLAKTTNHRTVAWLVAIRNLMRLVVPVVGAGLLFAAFDPSGLLSRAGEGRFFSIPPFVLILIGTGWLVDSLLAPRHKAFRLVPLDDDEAWAATRMFWVLGVAVSLSYLFTGLALRWNLSTATQSAMQFPLVLLASAALWRGAGLMKVARERMLAAALKDGSDVPGGLVAQRFLITIHRLVRIIAILAPLLAIAGYLPLASFLVFRTALALGLLASSRVVFDLLNKGAQVLFVSAPAQARGDDGLVPVVVAAGVIIAAMPLFAMVLGARTADIADFWRSMREGVTLGGIRLSATAVLTLVLVFAFVYGLTRLLQTLLRTTVLPRTRLDAGGRNAVLAGVGYLGFTAAGIASVSAAGLDLSNIAIVAGALSVGIGFGLQNIVSNFVSGIILLVERPVKEGDWIEVGGYSGHVRGINVRSTEIETFDRAIVILPNSDLIAGTVLNRTHKGVSGRLQVPVSVAYDSDPRKVEAILLEIAEENPLVLVEPAPRVLLLEFGSDAMSFELRCWLRDVNFSLSVRSDMNFEILERFGKEGVRIPFYGRDAKPGPPAEPTRIILERPPKPA